ncbi:MAG: hypothetical protein WBL61_02490 [Bryobacteraceae bacterium]
MMYTGSFPREVQISPHLMLLTVRKLTKENAELFEEVKQLRAAVNVYRELAMRKGPMEGKGLVFGQGESRRKRA